MSGAPDRPAWQKILIALILTAGLTFVAYYTWIYASIGARSFAGGTLLTDIRFFAGLLAVFAVLTLADRFINFVSARLGEKQ